MQRHLDNRRAERVDVTISTGFDVTSESGRSSQPG